MPVVPTFFHKGFDPAGHSWCWGQWWLVWGGGGVEEAVGEMRRPSRATLPHAQGPSSQLGLNTTLTNRKTKKFCGEESQEEIGTPIIHCQVFVKTKDNTILKG